jgi:ketosteroid isomerase-like protein
MSQANVDRFVKGIEAFNRNDIPGLLRSWIPRSTTSTGSRHCRDVGFDDVRGWFADLAEYFEKGQVQCPDVRDLGDRVLGLGTFRATGKESGVETELPFTVVARFKDGLVTHFIDYGDRDQALEAAGLRE